MELCRARSSPWCSQLQLSPLCAVGTDATRGSPPVPEQGSGPEAFSWVSSQDFVQQHGSHAMSCRLWPCRQLVSASQKCRSCQYPLSPCACRQLLRLRDPIAHPPPSLPGCSADSSRCSRRGRAMPHHNPASRSLALCPAQLTPHGSHTPKPLWRPHRRHREARSPTLGSYGKDTSLGSVRLGL